MKNYLSLFVTLTTALLSTSCSQTQNGPLSKSLRQNDYVSNIINGTPVASNDPIGKSTVALYISKATPENPTAIHNYCSGTLIAPQIIMTAAHCIAEYAVDEKTTPQEIANRTKVAFGLAVVQDSTSPNVEFRSISTVIIHPDYIPYSNQHVIPDIALLKLSQPTPPNTVIATLVSNSEILQSGLQIVLAGFGKVDGVHKIPATQLMKTTVTVDKAYYSKTQFTYNPIAGRAACRGDSGGPAYLNNGVNPPAVIGITSWGDATCEASGAYTSVPAMYPWIQSIIQRL